MNEKTVATLSDEVITEIVYSIKKIIVELIDHAFQRDVKHIEG